MTLRYLLKAALATASICAPTIVEAAAGRLNEEVCDQRLDRWSRRLLEQASIELDVHGREYANSEESFVVMSNHQSLYDIPVIFQALGRRIRMVTKKELFRIPIWGRAMRVAGFIEIDRRDRERAIESMRGAGERIRQGTDVWIAPEGTRSLDGSLGPFRKGGFHLALETHARILPVTIDGTRRVLPAGGRVVRPGARVTVTIHPPIDPKSFGALGIDVLMETVRSAIVKPLSSGLGP